MPTVRKSAIVPHSCATMFALVDRVEAYPEFLPWCSRVELLERTPEITSARLHVDYHGLVTRIATRNVKRPFESMELELADGATVGDAIAAAALARRFPGLDVDALEVGVWSRPCDRSTPLRDGDRVELYRPLQADAKAQRRARARLRPSSPRSRSGR